MLFMPDQPFGMRIKKFDGKVLTKYRIFAKFNLLPAAGRVFCENRPSAGCRLDCVLHGSIPVRSDTACALQIIWETEVYPLAFALPLT